MYHNVKVETKQNSVSIQTEDISPESDYFRGLLLKILDVCREKSGRLDFNLNQLMILKLMGHFN